MLIYNQKQSRVQKNHPEREIDRERAISAYVTRDVP